MTPEEVKLRVEEIRRIAPADDEAAHCIEDALYMELLRAIADGTCANPAACAAAALETQGIDFYRWCG